MNEYELREEFKYIERIRKMDENLESFIMNRDDWNEYFNKTDFGCESLDV